MAFRDLDKKVGDVLRVGYCHDKPWQILANHSGDNPKFSSMNTVTADNLLDAAPSIRYTNSGVTVEAKAGSTGAASVDLKYDFPKVTASKDTACMRALPLFTGLTFGSRFERRMMKSVASDSTDVSVEYKRDGINGRANLNPYSMRWDVAQCVTMDKISGGCGTLMLGGQMNGGSKDMSSLNYTVGAGYSHASAKPWAISLKASNTTESMAFGKLIGGFYAGTQKGHGLAAELQHNLADKTSSVTMGGHVFLSPKKDTWAKAKLLPNAQMACVLCHKFSDNLTGSFGCQFATTPKSTDEAKYGMKLALTC